MKHKRANKVLNANYTKGDPRRWEPGLNSIKRAGVNWRARWHQTQGLADVMETNELERSAK